MKKLSFLALSGLLSLILLSCGGSSNEYKDGYYENEPKKQFIKSPIDELIRDMKDGSTFSIILNDMDVTEDDNGTQYKHKYQIITEDGDSVQSKETAWMPVSEDMFWQHEKNMGMEVASRGEDGKINKVPAPAGMSNYVGNEKYGSWKTNSSGDSYWAFYGRYMFMTSMFRMGTYPYYRSDYYSYRSYRGRNQPYYGGTSAKPRYGTSSPRTAAANPNFHARKASSTAWKSSTARKATNYRPSSYGSSSKTSTQRSSSRYSSGSSSSGSSYRSSSSSYGK